MLGKLATENMVHVSNVFEQLFSKIIFLIKNKFIIYIMQNCRVIQIISVCEKTNKKYAEMKSFTTLLLLG